MIPSIPHYAAGDRILHAQYGIGYKKGMCLGMCPAECWIAPLTSSVGSHVDEVGKLGLLDEATTCHLGCNPRPNTLRSDEATFVFDKGVDGCSSIADLERSCALVRDFCASWT